MSKALANKVYNDGRILHATYNGETWTTNTYIAESGEVDIRVNKSTDDVRGSQPATPKMESIINQEAWRERFEVEQISDKPVAVVMGLRS